MPRELRLAENAGDSMMRINIPLKELAIIILLIWAGCFLCMIPDMLKEMEMKRMREKDWTMQKDIDNMIEAAE